MCPCPVDFLPQAAEESWDRLRVTCTQPFNKRSQFGLSFLRIRTIEDEVEDSSVQHEDIAAENLVRGLMKVFQIVMFKIICLYLYHISSSKATGLIGFNCLNCFIEHTRKDDIRDGVAFQSSYPKHIFWTNHRVCVWHLVFISKLDL